jgi:hypothetical protein
MIHLSQPRTLTEISSKNPGTLGGGDVRHILKIRFSIHFFKQHTAVVTREG